MIYRWWVRVRLRWAIRRLLRDAGRARRDPNYDGPMF